MFYLLAKILTLLILAALFGAWLARWWLRRHDEDVTSEYAHLQEQWRDWRHSFEERLAARPDVDLEPLAAGLQRVDASVRSIHIPEPVATDLTPVHSRLEALERAVAGIRMPVMPTIPSVDLTPLQERLDSVERAVRAIEIPAPKEADLSGVDQRLSALEQAVRAIAIPPATSVDLSALTDRLDTLAAKLAAQAVGPVAPVVEQRASLAAREPVAVPEPMSASEQPTVRAGSRNLLTRAHFGAPDDLKLIRGVKAGMERMLHDIGVYYFWQIAEWNPDDVVHADSQLVAFHGRIARDGWVSQAGELAAREDAARRPEVVA